MQCEIIGEEYFECLLDFFVNYGLGTWTQI